jgi:hypothetical protein
MDGQVTAMHTGRMPGFGDRKRLISLVAALGIGCLAQQVPAFCAPAYAHDPQVTREGSWYYLFSTGQGIPVQRSRNLVD